MATSGIERSPAKLLPDLVAEHAAKHGEALALMSGSGALTYSQLAGAIETYGRWALAHVAPGEAVGLLMPNRPEYVAIWLGITRVGGIVALMNTNVRGGALAHAIASAGLKQVIVAPEFIDAMHEAVPNAGSRIWSPEELTGGAGESRSHVEVPPVTIRNTALLIYTSGTTGLPKAAKVSHHRILQWSLWFAALGEFSPADRMYNCLPLYHSVGGIVAVGSVLSAGGSVAIAEKFSATRFWRDVVQFDCTLFQYIGELCRYLLNAPSAPEEREHSLRLACGNGLRADIWTKFKERFAIPHIIEFYAATEGTFSLFNIEDEPGAIGHVPPFLRPKFPAAIVRYDTDRQEEPYRDEGGGCVRCGPNEPGEALGRIGAPQKVEARFEGYTDGSETERKILHDVFEPGDAWYRTGDLMRMDERGFIYFVDRIGDTFRWKGENVSTSEVEQALSSCPGVLDVVVYGVNVPGADGRAGMAAIVPSDDFDLGALHHAAERLPTYARPLFVRLCVKLEATETFKPKKQLLAREGFDPTVIRDALYLDDGTRGEYVLLTEREFANFGTGSRP